MSGYNLFHWQKTKEAVKINRHVSFNTGQVYFFHLCWGWRRPCVRSTAREMWTQIVMAIMYQIRPLGSDMPLASENLHLLASFLHASFKAIWGFLICHLIWEPSNMTPSLILLIKYKVHYSCIEGLSGWNIFLMVSRAFGTLWWISLWAKLNNNNLLHLYSAFLDTQSALHSKGAISSSTTNVQHPPGWCDGSHSAPERPPHTSLLVERRQSNEANQFMGDD